MYALRHFLIMGRISQEMMGKLKLNKIISDNDLKIMQGGAG